MSLSRSALCVGMSLASACLVGQDPGTEAITLVAPGQRVRTSTEPAGANCPHGGVRLDSGTDDDGDGGLGDAEVGASVFFCNGAAGADQGAGPTGAGGEAGSLAVVRVITASDCPDGGQRVEWGLDADGDGGLDDIEVVGGSSVCHGGAGPTGATGADGQGGANVGGNVLVVVGDADASCAAGGIEVHIGVDADDDDILDPSEEVTTPKALCNGLDAPPGGGAGGTNEGSAGSPIALPLSNYSPLALGRMSTVAAMGASYYRVTTADDVVDAAPYSIDFDGVESRLSAQLTVTGAGDPVALTCFEDYERRRSCVTEPLPPDTDYDLRIGEVDNVGNLFFLTFSFGGSVSTPAAPLPMSLGGPAPSFRVDAVRAMDTAYYSFTPSATGVVTLLFDDVVTRPGPPDPLLDWFLHLDTVSGPAIVSCYPALSTGVQGCPFFAEAGTTYVVEVGNPGEAGALYTLILEAGDSRTPTLDLDSSATEPEQTVFRIVAPADGAATFAVTDSTDSAVTAVYTVESYLSAGQPELVCPGGGCVLPLVPLAEYYLEVADYSPDPAFTIYYFDRHTGDGAPGTPIDLVVGDQSSFLADGFSHYRFTTTSVPQPYSFDFTGSVARVEGVLFDDPEFQEPIAAFAEGSDRRWVFASLETDRDYYLALLPGEVHYPMDSPGSVEINLTHGDPITPVAPLSPSTIPFSFTQGDSLRLRVPVPAGGPVTAIVSGITGTGSLAGLALNGFDDYFAHRESPLVTCFVSSGCQINFFVPAGSAFVTLSQIGSANRSGVLTIATPPVTDLTLGTPVASSLTANGSAWFRFASGINGLYALDVTCTSSGVSMQFSLQVSYDRGTSVHSSSGFMGCPNSISQGIFDTLPADSTFYVQVRETSGSNAPAFDIVARYQ